MLNFLRIFSFLTIVSLLKSKNVFRGNGKNEK